MPREPKDAVKTIQVVVGKFLIPVGQYFDALGYSFRSGLAHRYVVTGLQQSLDEISSNIAVADDEKPNSIGKAL
jgi:hypothetical protein